jgi:hypothetical protein
MVKAILRGHLVCISTVIPFRLHILSTIGRYSPHDIRVDQQTTKLTVVADRLPYFLNTVELSQRGKILIGQRKGSDNVFRSEIFEMQLVGNTVKTLVSLPVPKRCSVFNFAKGDINGDGAEEVVVIDHENRLLVLNSQGEQIWKSDSRYGATSNLVEAKVVDREYSQIDYVSINSPILITDLNKDGIPEIIINDNLGQGRFMPEGFKYYDKSQITSLSWNQLGLMENWKTMEVGGMVTAFRIGDLTKGGVPQLIGSMVLAKDLLKIWDAKSMVFSYDLNIAPNPAEKKSDKRM